MAQAANDEKIIAFIKSVYEIPERVDQGIKTFNQLYESRLICYERMSTKGKIKHLFSGHGYSKGNPIDGIKIVNAREKQIIEIFQKSYKEMLPSMHLISSWKKEKAHIIILERYFEEAVSLQLQFLSKEKEFLEHKLSKVELKVHAEIYFSKLEEFSFRITQEFANFYSPKDFSALIKNTDSKILQHADLIANSAVFIAQFLLITNFNHSMPEKLITVEHLPSPAVFAEYLLICWILTIFNIPNKTYDFIKSYAKQTVSAIAELAKTEGKLNPGYAEDT